MSEEQPQDARTVFVVQGRNKRANEGLFAFLRAIGLRPMEWTQAIHLTQKGSPYIGEVLAAAFSAAQAVVVLLTPDEVAYLRSDLADPAEPDARAEAQARPNVLFEAGMAFGRHPERTILVELGKVRPFSDVAGMHAIRFDDNVTSRKELAQRLERAGCPVDLIGEDWLTAGDLEPPSPPGGGLPLGKRVPSSATDGVRVTARYLDRGKGSGRLQVTNHCSFSIHNMRIDLPEEAGRGFLVHQDGPVSRLPAGETASFVATRTSGGGRDHFDLAIVGETDDGSPIETTAFLSLLG